MSMLASFYNTYEIMKKGYFKCDENNKFFDFANFEILFSVEIIIGNYYFSFNVVGSGI